ncbi:MAG: hypothetical protein QMD00_06075 [Hadesarchaea archaeon]|nr:hypothetical protein [Hadesarchaea archaeon]
MRPEAPKFKQFESAFKEAIKKKKAEEGKPVENPATQEDIQEDLKKMGVTKEKKKLPAGESKELTVKIDKVVAELNNFTDEFEGLNEQDPDFLTKEEKEKFLETNTRWEPLISAYQEGEFDENTLKNLKNIKDELKGILIGAYNRYSKISPPKSEKKEKVKSLKSQLEEGWDWLSRKKQLERKRKSFKKPNI